MIESKKAKKKSINDYLRQDIKYIKLMNDFSYKDICEILNFKYSSFLAWLNGTYDYGEDKQILLKDFISNVKGEN